MSRCLAYGQKDRIPARLPRPVHSTGPLFTRLGQVMCLLSPTVLQPSDGAHAESYPVTHLANPHSSGPSISSRARLCWCQTTLFIFPFSMQPAGSVLTSFLLLKLWLHCTMVICLHVHPSPLPSPLSLNFFWGLISMPFLSLLWRLKVGFLIICSHSVLFSSFI